MAGSTITGSVGGVNVAVNTSSGIQQGFTAQVLNSASSTNPVVFTTASGALTTRTAIVSAVNSVVSGATSVPSATVLLNGQNDTYINGGTTLSTVVAADDSNSTVVNANPQGALVAATGAGNNVLAGFVKANQFVTGENGHDAVILDGASNTLTSNGDDAVLVGGPSTITATASGLDDVVMTRGTTLSFTNSSQPSALDSITGASGGAVALAGSGSTSVKAGAGPESFDVDTASGNVTLTGNAQGADTFTFSADGLAGQNQTTVVNFAATDVVMLHGYSSYQVTSLAGNPGGSMLTLSDGAKVTFADASSATVTAAIKTS